MSQHDKGLKRELVIIGASGHGKVIADIAKAMDQWEEIYFLDDNAKLDEVMGIKVLGKIAEVDQYLSTSQIVVAIGNNTIREAIQRRLKEKKADIPVLSHPSAVIGSEVSISVGTVVMAGAVINCCSQIGEGCIINTGATIDHDNIIGNYVHLSPGVCLAGSVEIGNKSWLGIGSVVINNVTIAGNTQVGAGAVVTKDIISAGTYLGIPAKENSKVK